MTNNTADFTAHPDYLYTHSAFSRSGNKYPGNWTYTPIYRDRSQLAANLRGGTRIVIDGRPAIVSGGRSNMDIRFEDDGMPARIPGGYVVDVVSYNPDYRDRGLPKLGEVVRVLKGEHADKIGIVYKPGMNSTYVVFVGTDEKIKFGAKLLQIVKGRIVLD